MIIKQINLNPIEATAYWWMDTIRNKVREIYCDNNHSINELDFMNLFSEYTEEEWRKIYLNLTEYIGYKVEKYVPHGLYGIDEYNQDTSRYYHKDINELLTNVLNNEVPDIDLSNKKVADSIVCTNKMSAYRYFKSGGITPLNTNIESNYILTGNKNELNFYNLLMSVIAVLSQKNHKINSVDALRNIFCDIYIDLYGHNIDKKIILDNFNNVLNQLYDKGLISNMACNNKFDCNFTNFDLVGLNEYIEKSKTKIIK